MYVGVDMTPEQAVLGCILSSGELIYEVTLQPYHFLVEKHRIIFSNMKELVEEDSAIDILLLTTKLVDKKLIEQVDGVSYLYNLSSSVATLANINHYEQLIFQAYREYAARELAARLMEKPTDENIHKAATYLGDLLDFQKADSVDNEQLILDLSADMMKTPAELGNISSGIASLDQLTGGWNKGELSIIAGRPSMGKTAFALTVATEACLQDDAMISFFSIEMTAKELMKRLINAKGKINGNKWKNPKQRFQEEDFHHFAEAAMLINGLQLKLNDSSSLTTAQISSIMRKRVRKYPDYNHIVIIDYLQILDVPGRFERHDLKIASITKGLKQLAVTLNIPVICLSQLSRGVEKRDDKRPMLSDLRDSGSIEQDADNVLFLYRDDYYNRDEPNNNLIEISIQKQRSGATGMFKMVFQREYGVFVEVGG